MKINQNYKLREVAGETIVVNQGTAGMDMTRIISLNVSARLLYESLAEKEFTTEDAAHILTATYGIGHEQAIKDAQVWAGDTFLLVIPILFLYRDFGGEVNLLTLDIERNPYEASSTLFLVFPEICLYRTSHEL